ncbi:MAG: class I SAM-dependent methyltransferase [Rhodospirillaceae bacterium]|jgi:predicted O-methyltransferase YrrM|nr:class I SAM-dependent methyltransferase [Rhodospirillaceae bacterium]MBT5245369.1 class I SAM-dependent methyltransferase [Rhodospirillaceae bacterium]MBT5562525.1 class I SAM-dependent methyltransferase [Rhodospirillaceae bacterium]MBT6242902.1 class I SAM-dependent methyltransferase [Rhodospirillaceae bacterium]
MEHLSSARSFLKMPVVMLFGSQFLAAVSLFLVIFPIYTSFNDTMPSLPVIFAVQGVVAATIGIFFGLAKWWTVVQVALPFAAFYSAHLQIPAFVWLLLFGLCALIYWNSARDGIPLYLSNSTTWAALAQVLPEKEGIRIIDLGGGVGGTALYLARNRPDAQILSMESAPIPAFISKLRWQWCGLKNVEMRSENFWKENLSAYQVVYAFLSPVPMSRLYEKVKAEMEPGSLFISNSFDVEDVQADEVLELNDNRQTKLYLYRN